MAKSNRPPLEMDELTNNLKQSTGRGIDALFSTPPPKAAEEAKPEPTPSPTPNPEPAKEVSSHVTTSRRHDVMTSSLQDNNHRKWREIIENTEVHNSSLRVTNGEVYSVEDTISELRRKQKVKTSMNELARLGMLYLIDDFKKNKQNSIIVKVKKS